MIEITLQLEDALRAATVGAERRLRSRYAIRRQWVGWEETTFDQDIEGAGAELALARALELHWTGDVAPHQHAPDVGPFHVRQTAHRNGHLPIHEDDPATAPFVLVVGRMPWYRIVGWILADDGRAIAGERKCLHPKGRPAWWVPADRLRSPHLLAEAAR